MKARLVAGFIVLMLTVGFLQFKFDNRLDYMAEKDKFVSLPTAKTLKVISFGFHDVVADLLYVWAIQFYSTNYFVNRYDFLEQIFDVITDLAPNYQEPYYVGSWIMALEARDLEMAIRLLEKGSRNNPSEWFFDYECGSYAGKLKDFERAEFFFTRAASRPGAPPHVKRRQAHQVYMRNDLNRAWQMWLEIYRNATRRMEKDSAFNHLFMIKFQRDSAVLKRSIQLYKNRYGRLPYNVEQLVRAGLIREIPRDFSKHPYKYNPQTGEISPRKMFKWKN